MNPEVTCFRGVVLSQTWWAYAAAIVLWLIIVGWYWLKTAKYLIKEYGWKVWLWWTKLTGHQKRRVATVAVLGAVVSALACWGLLAGRLVYRQNTYARAIADWTGYVAAKKPPKIACLEDLVASVKDDRAKGFVAMGKAICAGFPNLAARDQISVPEIEALGELLSYWWGPAPTDVVVQGHEQPKKANPAWVNHLPRTGVMRPAWVGGGEGAGVVRERAAIPPGACQAYGGRPGAGRHVVHFGAAN